MNHPRPLLVILAAALASGPLGVNAEENYPGYGYEPTKEEHIGVREYSPCLDIGYPQRVFRGDTHLHTSPIWHTQKG